MGSVPVTKLPTDKDGVTKQIHRSPDVQEFIELGTKLLEDSDKPNVLSLEEFTPFIELFNVDKERYWEGRRPRTGEPYVHHINMLYQQFIRRFNINLYHPTLVVVSKEDPKPKIVYYLDRVYTKIRSDLVNGETSHRAKTPGAVNRASGLTRDDLLMDASLKDIIAANHEPDQIAYFSRVRAESSWFLKNFVMRNASDTAKISITGGAKVDMTSTGSPSQGETDIGEIELDED